MNSNTLKLSILIPAVFLAVFILSGCTGDSADRITELEEENDQLLEEIDNYELILQEANNNIYEANRIITRVRSDVVWLADNSRWTSYQNMGDSLDEILGIADEMETVELVDSPY